MRSSWGSGSPGGWPSEPLQEVALTKRICVIGTGYAGLANAACLADLGNGVIGVDRDQAKIEQLNHGVLPIYEPGLAEIVRRNIQAGRLVFSTSYDEGMQDAELVFVCVGTPSGVEGETDLADVEQAAIEVAKRIHQPVVIVNRSTVPIGTGDWMSDIIRDHLQSPDTPFTMVSNPEFLREGSAVYDWMHPDRIVLGTTDPPAAEKVSQLYRSLGAELIITDPRTAEMIKYAANAFLASKISFINEIANICEALGADVRTVAHGMGTDQRISPHFLEAGIGWGGSCFPKDVKALAYIAAVHGQHPQMLRAVMEINTDQRKRAVTKVREILGGFRGKVIGVWGLTFKPNTDDLRDAPSISIIHMLQNEGAIVRAYDPVAMDKARNMLPRIVYCDSPYSAAEDADAVFLVTEWNEFKQLDMARVRDLMRRPILLDGRNVYDPQRMREMGFIYRGMGRGYSGESLR
ncbi:MAG: UDP-glucose/GDP-mannose dehydrogenase family protein [Anaerolineae bacterium]|nr:UDP-glucose/GDP-mannose dehydrogenase family protein [Anaerolineae bacterium]